MVTGVGLKGLTPFPLEGLMVSSDMQMVSGDFSVVDEVALHIATDLLNNEVPSAYAIMGLGLLMGRLLHGAKPTDDEVRFVEELTGWASSFYGSGVKES